MKNSLERFKGRYEQAEERISEREGMRIEIIEAGEEKEKRLNKSEQCLKDLWDMTKQTNICIMGVPEEEAEKETCRENGVKNVFNEVTAEHFPSLRKK